MSGIRVRGLQEGDHAAWLALWHAYNVFYGRTEDPPVPPEITAAAWARFFDPGEPLWALVAEDETTGEPGGEILGFTHFLYHRSTNHIQPVCYLEDLFTAEAARGRGVGRALIEAVGAAARAAGSDKVYWLTQEGNATARALYDRLAAKTHFIVYERET